jgi:hypothetical protein
MYVVNGRDRDPDGIFRYLDPESAVFLDFSGLSRNNPDFREGVDLESRS